PFDRDVVGRVRGVLHPGVRLDPVDALAVLAPECVRIADRGLVHRLVLGVVDVGALRPFGGDFVNRVGHARSSTVRGFGCGFRGCLFPAGSLLEGPPARDKPPDVTLWSGKMIVSTSWRGLSRPSTPCFGAAA